MNTLSEIHVEAVTRARIGRLLTRYRVIIHVALLALACSLAYADRQHAQVSPPRIAASQVGDTD